MNDTGLYEVPPPEQVTFGEAKDRMISYARNSLERVQAISAQDGEVYEWADSHGLEIVGMARDNNVDGRLPAMERPGLSAAVRAVEEGRADGIVVQCFDRLARDFYAQDDALQRIWNAGGRFFTCDPGQEWKPDVPGDPQWMSRLGYARMAEDERRALLARLQRARRQKIARGGYGGGHRIRRRYGMELVEIRGKLEYRPIPEEQAVIKRIHSTCAVAKGYAAMARALNEEGVPTVDGVPWSRKVVRDLALRGPDRMMAVPPQELPAFKPLEWVREATA